MDESLKGRCLFAIPKKGRLYEKCLHLLKNIDIKYRRQERLDLALSSNFNLALLFLPAADIALYVAQGRVDLGITGQDIVAESNVQVEECLKLGFGECRLCLQAPESEIKNPKNSFIGKRIVTSFKRLSTEYFDRLAKEENVPNETQINYVSGSVEVACQLGLADAVVDLVESGTTMKAAGLGIVDVLMTTQAVLIGNPKTKHRDIIDNLKRRISGVIMAEKYAVIEYNVEKKNLSLAEKITPGQKSPTVSSLEDANWVAVKCMILRTEIYEKMDQLQAIGATDIYITNIANCRP